MSRVSGFYYIRPISEVEKPHSGSYILRRSPHFGEGGIGEASLRIVLYMGDKRVT
jgi:hypothetical protein